MQKSPAAKPIRCAIYTRKSSEEGLEQDFNSLDAQREACEAFIRSQKHEGWVSLPEMYDDGGISGATLERPSLQRLLAAIEARRVDTVVVYKVDRLTRSLNDFAKIVEVFDRQHVSFVSVTQQFNTTSSMGRLTLNMLLSFAQFEREVTGERIRDKIAASKAKGMWMGGLPPLGYDVKDRKLVINEKEAETVRHIYRRYKALGSVRDLKAELDRDGIVSKSRLDKFNRPTGNKPLARGALYLILQNRLYRGEIVHKEKAYPGEHAAIIDAHLWEAVQQTLAKNRVERETGAGANETSLLAGLLFDGDGNRMTPTHANKKGARYRYYVSQGLITGARASSTNGRRVPAGDLETLVQERIVRLLTDEAKVIGAIEPHVANIREAKAIAARAKDLGQQWTELPAHRRRAVLLALVDRIELMPATIEIYIRPQCLPTIFEEEPRRSTADSEETIIVLTIPVQLKRTGMENRLSVDASSARNAPDRSLRRLLAQAHRYHRMVMSGSAKTMAELAAEVGVVGSYFTRVLRLSFLAPEVTRAILQDRHPATLNAKQLANYIEIPIGWDEQRRMLAGE